MQFGFDTQRPECGKCALILYAMYRSRNADSPLNGLETWSRFNAYIRGAAIKASNTAEFVQHFCHTAKVGSVKPRYLKTGAVFMPDGTFMESDNVQDYKLDVLCDDSLLPIFEHEGIYLTMLVRERIQREKLQATNEEDEDDDC